MSTAAPRGRKRGGLGKYLRARGRRGTGRPAEFGKRLVLEGEEEGNEDEEDEEDGSGSENKYARRQLGTNADRYEEPEVDPHEEQEPEPEVDLSSFLERQRLASQEDRTSPDQDEDEDVDHTLSNLPSTSASVSNTRKNKTRTIEWDASMDELKREKEAAEAVWDLKSRFRKNQPRLVAKPTTSSRRELRSPPKIEDSRHVYKPPDPDSDPQKADAKPANKNEMEDFLDDLLS